MPHLKSLKWRYDLRVYQLFSKRTIGVFALCISTSVLTSCSSQESEPVEASGAAQNSLAELSFTSNSSDAYRRACYWGSQGDNIFLYERIKEGNSLAEQEGKLPLAGLEQAMGIVLQKGEPQAPEQYELVQNFCAGLGFQFLD
jgi:hypothetical protein